jgi:hypothetical protein
MSIGRDMASPDYRRELGAGLVVRWSSAADAEAIADTCGHVFRRTAEQPPNVRLGSWIRDLMSGKHPLMGQGDYAVVEETATGRIVSGTCLFSHAIELEGIRLPFGRPEVVFSHPAYRDRGLVRATFELVHARSASRGHLVQGITGIPYYYHLFGYEYAADLGGELSVYFAAIPPLQKGETERYRLQIAKDEELSVVRDLYDRDRARYALTTPMEESYLRWIASGQNPRSLQGWTARLVVDSTSCAVGYVLTDPCRDSDEVGVKALGTREGVGLAQVLPSVLRALRDAAGEAVPARDDLPAPARVRLMLWPHHPVYDLLKEEQRAGRRRPYAWYLRVPDVKSLVGTLRPVLERRLAASAVAGFSGELRLTFYPKGIRLAFEEGRLMVIEDWRPDHAWGPRAQAGVPSLVFLKLLFGYRSLDELRDGYPDVFAEDEVRPVLEALFPPRPSWLIPLY